MTLLSSKLRRTHTAHLAAAMVVLVLALLTGATSASADIEGKFEGHLPGKTWTTNGAYGYMTFLWGETISGEGSVCVTPAEYSGGWSFPYGWQCNKSFSNPYVATTYGYPAVDNPNSRELGFRVGYN